MNTASAQQAMEGARLSLLTCDSQLRQRDRVLLRPRDLRAANSAELVTMQYTGEEPAEYPLLLHLLGPARCAVSFS